MTLPQKTNSLGIFMLIFGHCRVVDFVTFNPKHLARCKKSGEELDEAADEKFSQNCYDVYVYVQLYNSSSNSSSMVYVFYVQNFILSEFLKLRNLSCFSGGQAWK